MKSQFFANVSHELRTPLTLILSPIQDLLRRPESLSDKVSGLLRTARDNSLRLLKLVNDLLEVIRLEEGKSELLLRPVDLNVFLRGIVDSMLHMAEPRKISFHKRLSAEPIVILADAYALERIFLNLLSNAIKFTPEGGSITISSVRNERQALIEVADTGIGINKSDLPFIFDRFRQADGTSTRRYQGSGLGLALVKDLTEKLGGAVTVKSEPQVGTTMALSLPLAPSQALENVAETPRPSRDFVDGIHQTAEHRSALPIDSPFEKAESQLPPGDGPSLMIVDDEPDMRQYLVTALESDYRVCQARGGRQALELARKLQPDLMVLDLMLPEIDGHQVCKLLKSDPETRRIKIILLTARIDESAKITALENGADDFLTKPFSRTEVETRLRNLLETAKLETDLRNRNQELATTLAELKQTQASLIQSEKLNALGSLAAGLLHEVNNPLNYVITALQLAQQEPEVEASADLKDFFVDIDEGVERIRHIVSDLHTFAHPSEVDKQKAFTISAAVETALRFAAHDCSSIRIETDLSGPDRAIGSQGHVIQVLVNLLRNSANALQETAGKRPGEIRLRSAQRDGRVYFTVADNGPGMTEAVRKRVFDPFFTTRDVGQGMGLGLSICHTIVKNHGGTMTVRSEPGQGAEFTFDVPMASPDSAPQELEPEFEDFIAESKSQ